LAAQAVRDQDLIPTFNDASGSGTGTRCQSPVAGITVTAGSEVRMRVVRGPLP
jgi:hypothetical protein